MSSGAVLLIGIPVLAVLVLAALLVTSRRRDRDATASFSREAANADKSNVPSASASASAEDITDEARERGAATGQALARSEAATPVARSKAVVVRDPEEVAVTRRQFFNRGIIGAQLLAIGGFGAASVAFLWPSSSGGFGSVVQVPDSYDDILASLAENRAPVYVPEGRFYINPYPADPANLEKAAKVYTPDILAGMEEGLVALWQTCPHLGCRVPWCATSQWFECPCHGSKYNRVGEKTGGPAPRGMDHFPISVSSSGSVSVNTGALAEGPPIGTNTTGQNAEGPFCF